MLCSACKDKLTLKQSIIKNHIESSKHVRSKGTLGNKEAREHDIAQAMKEYMRGVGKGSFALLENLASRMLT